MKCYIFESFGVNQEMENVKFTGRLGYLFHPDEYLLQSPTLLP